MNLLSSLLKYTADQIAALRAKNTSQDDTVSGINTRLGTAETKVTNMEAQLATAISAVTVDSEVQNVRVGDDNVTYTSAGESVRTQFANAKSDLSIVNNEITDVSSAFEMQSVIPFNYGNITFTNALSNLRIYRNKNDLIFKFKSDEVFEAWIPITFDSVVYYTFHADTIKSSSYAMPFNVRLYNSAKTSSVANIASPTADVSNVTYNYVPSATGTYYMRIWFGKTNLPEVTISLLGFYCMLKSDYDNGVIPTRVLSDNEASRIYDKVNANLNSALSPVNPVVYYANGAEEIAFTDQHKIDAGFNIGTVIDLTPVANSIIDCAVVECEYGSRFILNGTGPGGNTRLWAFVDENNVLLGRAYQSIVADNLEIVTPLGAKKMIINRLRSNIGNCYFVPSAKLVTEIKDTINYELERPTADTAMYAYANGLKFSDELQTHLADFKKPTDKFAHVPTFKIINGVVYVTYYCNTRSNQENPSELTARFAYAPLNDLTNQTYIDLQDVGETFDGKTVTAIYDTILMSKDSNTLYLMWTAQLDGDYCRLYRTYTISTNTLSAVNYNTFTLNGTTENFTVSNLTTMFTNKGISHKPFVGDIGLMQKLSTRVESGTTFYYTGMYIGCFNCIVKSSDLINWVFVAQPDFFNESKWENATYVIGDTVYYFVRQGNMFITTGDMYKVKDEYNVGFLTSYNLNYGVWSPPVYITDCQSRSDFLLHNGDLYLIHAPKDRYHIGIMKINTGLLSKSCEVQTASTPFYFYPYADSYNGELYMIFVEEYQHIWLSKFSIESIAESTINNIFKTLLEI